MSKSGNSEQMYYVALIWKDFQNLSYIIVWYYVFFQIIIIFFFQTDVCGIRWIVFREPECPSGTSKVQNGHDAVLASFAKCLDADLLAVWRRVPKRSLLGMKNKISWKW